MKKLIFLMLALMIGQAVASPLFGPPQGFRNNGLIELGALKIDGVEINGGDISYDEFVSGMVTNETAINTSIDALTLAAYTNETAINASIAAQAVSQVTNETAINLSIISRSNGVQLSAYQNETDINETIAAQAVSQVTNETAINKTAANVALGQTWQNNTLANLALGQTAQNNSITNLGLGTTAINTTLSKMLYGSGAINASTSISTVLTSSNTKTVFPMDGSGGHVTLTLPDAATNAGRVYMVVLAADMGGNNVIVDTTGAGNLGGTSGPDSLTTTDAAAALTVLSDGTNYLVLNRDGTWG